MFRATNVQRKPICYGDFVPINLSLRYGVSVLVHSN